MAERSLDIVGAPPVKLVYEPGPGETIGRIEITLPGDGIIYETETVSQSEASSSFRRQCGNTTCSAHVYINTIGTAYRDGSRIVWNAGVSCSNDDCPLGQSRGGGAYDREPRNPLSPLPELQARQPLPQEVQS